MDLGQLEDIRNNVLENLQTSLQEGGYENKTVLEESILMELESALDWVGEKYQREEKEERLRQAQEAQHQRETEKANLLILPIIEYTIKKL